MKIVNETELMANQKASTVIVPDKQFEALQTIEGKALVFSIGTDGILYCTREVPGDTHGWVKVDLSSSLSAACYGGAAITAETFDIAQDMTANTQSVDIALVVNSGGKDYLHLVTGFKNTFENWTSGAPVFKADSQYKFDYPGENIPTYQAMPINDVQIVDSNDGNAMQYIIVDLVSDAATQTTSRFYIDNTKQKGYAWLPHDLSGDLTAGKITTFIGCGPNDGPDSYPGAGDGAGNNTGGAYVLGSVAGKPQLQYTPAYNFNHPEETPDPTVFNFPAGTNDTYMAMDVSCSAANAPYTDLFFATNGQLYFLACADQNDSGSGKPTLATIYTHDLFQNIQSLHVKNWNDNIVIWGQSLDPADMQTSRLFIMEGIAGQETNAAAWSTPIPLLFNVVNSSAYVNNIHSLDSKVDTNNGNAYGSCNVLFAEQVTKNADNSYTSSLTQLFQDPVTSAWQARSLLTSPTSENVLTEIYETTSYTTHIRVTDDNNMVQPFMPVSIWSSSPCSTYVNNTYSNLAFDAPLQTTADEGGVINIMQPVDTIGGISFYIAVQDPNTKQWFTQVINPLAVTMSNIKTQVPDGNPNSNYLNGSVKDEMGKATPLTPNATADQQTATTGNIYQFYTNGNSLNADGLTTDQEKAGGWPNPATVLAQLAETAALVAAAPVQPAGKGSRVNHNKPATVKRIKKFAIPDRQAKNLRFNPATKIWGCTFGENAKHYEGVEALKEMGLVVNADGTMALTLPNGQSLGSSDWIEAKAGHLFKWMMSEAEKLEKAVIQLGEDGLDCLLTIAGTIYHFVAKCANDIANAIHTMLNAIKTAFADLIKWIGSIFAWCDFINTHAVIRNLFIQYGNYCIKNIDKATDGVNTFASNIVASIDDWAGFPDDSAQSQSAANNQDKGQHKPQSNWGHHHMKNNAANAAFSLAGNDISDLISSLMTTIENEGEIIMTNGQKLKDIDFTTISMGDLMKQIAAMIADDLVQSIQNIIVEFLTLIGELVDGMMDNLAKQELKIPVISQLYERFVGSPLTILDLFCLVVAIPVTVIYKIANDTNPPFAANDPFATAPDYESLGLLCIDQSSVSASAQVGDWEPPTLNDRWYRLFFAGNVMAFFGGIGIAALGYMKTKDSSSKTLATLYAICYLPYVGPDVIGNFPAMKENDTRAFSIVNGALGITGVVKAFVDIAFVSAPPAEGAVAVPGWFSNSAGLTGYGFISLFLDLLLNAAWEYPVVEAYTHSEKIANDIVDLVANTAFNTSGIISPLVAFKVPPGDLFWAGVGTALNVVYGAGSLLESLDGQPIDPIKWD